MLRPRVVVVVAYEPEDAGPVPGEATLLIERLGLRERLRVSGAFRDAWVGGDVLLLAAGVGAARAAVSLMALAARVDLSAALVVVCGVAGADPAQASLGSVVVPSVVVDGDLCHELDAREIPPDWPDGFVPLGKSVPYEQPRADRFDGGDGLVFRLDPALVAWALDVSAEVELMTSPEIEARAAEYGFSGQPRVVQGDELATTTFWHGRLLAERAARWVAYQAGGTYTITAMEDAGLLTAARALGLTRLLVVRGVSNYDRQRPGTDAATSLREQRVAGNSGYRPALENVARVVCRLVAALC